MAERSQRSRIARRPDRNVYETAEIVLSIFGLIGLGYAVARLGILGPQVAEGVSDFVFKVAMPALLFRTLATADLAGISPWSIWIPFYAGVAAVWAAAHLIIRHGFGRDLRAALIAGFSAGYSNLALIGVPLVHAAFGPEGTVVAAMLLAVNLPFLTTIASIINEAAGRAEGAGEAGAKPGGLLRQIAGAQLRNPILIGVLAGIVWLVAGLPIPGPLGGMVGALAQVAGPSALFVSGMTLAGYGVARQISTAAVVSVLKLVAMPAVVFLIGWLIGLPPLVLQVLTVSAACPTGVTAGILAARFGTGQALASNALLISTAAAVGSISAWLMVVRALAP